MGKKTFKRVDCNLLILLDFYQEKKLVKLSIVHSDNPDYLLTEIYRHTTPGSTIRTDNEEELKNSQNEANKYRLHNINRKHSRTFTPLTTRDMIVLGEFVTHYIAKNTNMDVNLDV